MRIREISTKRGKIPFPAFLPVTTFGEKFPLDDVIRPHLSRFAPALMVSYHYAQGMTDRPKMPLFIDSGGFASLFRGAEIVEDNELAYVRTKEGSVIHPAEVLVFQERNAEIGATLDFIIHQGHDHEEALRRQELTIQNALWAVQKRSRDGFRLYASVQAWDSLSAHNIMERLVDHPFDGFALGGMVPRVNEPESILAIVKAIREVDKDRPLHVFGMGAPRIVRDLFAAGVDTVDSSSFVQHAADKKYLDPGTGRYQELGSIDGPKGCCECRLCKVFSREYYALKGELNTMALALHNLSAVIQYLTHSMESEINRPKYLLGP